MKAAAAPGVSGEAFNIGTGASITVLDLIAARNRLLGTAVAPQYGPPRAGDVRYSRADISKARRLLGYDPAVPFAEGLARTVAAQRAAV